MLTSAALVSLEKQRRLRCGSALVRSARLQTLFARIDRRVAPLSLRTGACMTSVVGVGARSIQPRDPDVFMLLGLAALTALCLAFLLELVFVWS